MAFNYCSSIIPFIPEPCKSDYTNSRAKTLLVQVNSKSKLENFRQSVNGFNNMLLVGNGIVELVHKGTVKVKVQPIKIINGRKNLHK